MLHSIVKDRFGQHYKIQTARDPAVTAPIKHRTFWHHTSARQFLSKLVVPMGYWRRVLNQYTNLPCANDVSDKEIEVHLSHLLVAGRIKLYPVKLPSFSESPPQNRTVKAGNGVSYRFAHASSLLLSTPRETRRFSSAGEAEAFIHELNPELKQLQSIAIDLDVEVNSNSSSSQQKLTAAISQAMAKGEVVIIVDKTSSVPAKKKPEAEKSTVGNRRADLGPHTSAPQQAAQPSANTLAIQSIAAKSPTLVNNLSSLRQQGWKITRGPEGGGSYADKTSKTITIDAAEFNNPAGYVQTIAHESGHALYSQDPYVPPNGLTRQEYVDTNANSSLKDEGEATLMNIQVRNEIKQNNGPDIGIAGTQGDAYDKAYQDYLQHGDREKARTEIGNIFANNERPSTAPDMTYKQYYSKPYEDYWDNNIKRP